MKAFFTQKKTDIDGDYASLNITELHKVLWRLHQQFLSALRKGEHLLMKNASQEINKVMKVIDEKLGMHKQ